MLSQIIWLAVEAEEVKVNSGAVRTSIVPVAMSVPQAPGPVSIS